MELTGKDQTIIGSVLYTVLTQSDWEELFQLCEEEDYFSEHTRFLRSLHWDDQDAKGNCIDAFKFLLPRHLAEVMDFVKNKESFQKTILKRSSELYNKLFDEAEDLDDVSLGENPTDSDILNSAIDDAEIMIEEGRPENAYDRIHTALHGIVKSKCIELSINFGANDNLGNLLSQIRNRLASQGGDAAEIAILIASLTKITGILDGFRNKNSLAHPTKKLLDSDEALFAINISKALIKYIKAKI